MEVEPYLGAIGMFGGNFNVRGWAFCDGQLLAITQNSALFSLYGTIYGGDGRTTFALPELRGRVAMHMGTGPGLSPRQLGQRSGAPTTTLNSQNIPAHNHLMNAGQEGKGVTALDTAAGNFPGNATGAYRQNSGGGTLNSTVVNNTGNNTSFSNMQPYQVITYQCALQGIYPTRN